MSYNIFDRTFFGVTLDLLQILNVYALKNGTFSDILQKLKLIVLLTAFIFRLNPFLLKFKKNKIEAHCPSPPPLSPKNPILCSVEKVLIYGKSSCLQGILINTYF